jgi:hypothetical protein
MMKKELQNKKLENHGSSSMLSNKTNSENNCCTLSRKRSQTPHLNNESLQKAPGMESLHSRIDSLLTSISMLTSISLLTLQQKKTTI